MYAVIHFPPRENDLSIPEISRDDLRRIASSFSPLFEIIDVRTVAIDVRGLELLFPGGFEEILEALRLECLSTGREAQIALAASLAQSVLGALCLPGVTILGNDQDDSVSTLRNLPLDRSGLSARYLEIFAEWGINTVGDLVSLPEHELIARLGGEIEPFLQSLTGQLPRHLQSETVRPEFSCEITPEDPLENIFACLGLIESMLARLIADLNRYALAAGAVTVGVNGDEPTVINLRLPVPSTNLRFIMKLLTLEFEQTETGIIRSLSLTIKPEVPRRVQPSFWQASFPDSESLGLTLAKLRRLLGDENVGRPAMLDSYHARHFQLESGISPTGEDVMTTPEHLPPLVVFRHFPKPRPVRLEHGNGVVFFIEENATERRRVTKLSGPWISSGNWWAAADETPDGRWHRRELDVELSGGRIYRLVERRDGGFFAEGYYD